MKRSGAISKNFRESEDRHFDASRIVNREELLRTSRFVIERRWQRLPDKQLQSREVILHPGAVVILPLLDDGRICLIRNYRIALDRELLELPAGTREVGEDPMVTARRELQEETGYTAENLQPLCEFLMSPGILDERMHAFVATGLTPGTQALEPGEAIQNEFVTLDEVRNWIATGKIEDAKTITSLLYYFQIHSSQP